MVFIVVRFRILRVRMVPSFFKAFVLVAKRFKKESSLVLPNTRQLLLLRWAVWRRPLTGQRR